MSKGLHNKVNRLLKEKEIYPDFGHYYTLFNLASEMLEYHSEVGYVPVSWRKHTLKRFMDDQIPDPTILEFEKLWNHYKYSIKGFSKFQNQRDWLKQQKGHFRSEYFAHLIAHWMKREWVINDDDLLDYSAKELYFYAKEHLLNLYWLKEYNEKVDA